VTEFTHGSGEGGWGAARADLTGWAVERIEGPAAALHGLGLPDPPRRLLRWCRATAAALVLGSAQPADHVDAGAAAAAGLTIVRRRTGGSSVVVGPGRLLWLDAVLPAGDPLWDDDVGVAPLWLGRAWMTALEAVGVREVAVHSGAMRRTRWSDAVCFAGTGPGEVVSPRGKVVGVSQRRTRAGALFQSAALLRWDPDEAVGALALDRVAAAEELRDAAAGLDVLAPGVAPAGVEQAVQAAVTAASGDGVR
jgi:lipoate-protein ligase A